MKSDARRNLTAALAVLALMGSACAAGGAGSLAALNVWPAGTTVNYVSTSAQSQAMDIPGMGEQASNSSSSTEFAIEAVGERQFKITVTDASINMDQPDPTGMMPSIDTLIGLEAMLTLDERGEVMESSGIAGNPWVEYQGGAEAYIEELRSFFQYLPEEPLRPGVTWSREYGFTANQQGLDLNFEFVDTYNCVAEIIFEGTRALKIESKQEISMGGGGDQMGIPVDFALSGTGDGTVIIDAATGMLLSNESKGTMTGGISAQGMDIPMTMTMTSGIKVK